MKTAKTLAKIRTLAGKIEQLKVQQRMLGLFCEDRELLTCSHCGLEEDVAIAGILIVTNHADRSVDTGLRYAPWTKKKGCIGVLGARKR